MARLKRWEQTTWGVRGVAGLYTSGTGCKGGKGGRGKERQQKCLCARCRAVGAVCCRPSPVSLPTSFPTSWEWRNPRPLPQPQSSRPPSLPHPFHPSHPLPPTPHPPTHCSWLRLHFLNNPLMNVSVTPPPHPTPHTPTHTRTRTHTPQVQDHPEPARPHLHAHEVHRALVRRVLQLRPGGEGRGRGRGSRGGGAGWWFGGASVCRHDDSPAVPMCLATVSRLLTVVNRECAARPLPPSQRPPCAPPASARW